MASLSIVTDIAEFDMKTSLKWMWLHLEVDDDSFGEAHVCWKLAFFKLLWLFKC